MSLKISSLAPQYNTIDMKSFFNSNNGSNSRFIHFNFSKQLEFIYFKYKNFILLISRLTILFAKKVVAYSTILRQLGFNKNVINSCWQMYTLYI